MRFDHLHYRRRRVHRQPRRRRLSWKKATTSSFSMTSPRGSKSNVPNGAELVVADIRSDEAAELIVDRGVEMIVHHAAQMDVRRSVKNPAFDADVNLGGLLNLIEAARKGNVRQVVFASTGGAIYGEQDVHPADEDHPARPVSPYGVAKLASERYLFYYFCRTASTPPAFATPTSTGRARIRTERPASSRFSCTDCSPASSRVINGDGKQTRDYVYVGDVVRANLAAIGHPGFNTYNVGTGVETDVNDLFATSTEPSAAGPTAAHGPGKPGEQQRSSISSALLERELGVTVATPLAEGLTRTADWFRDNARRP